MGSDSLLALIKRQQLREADMASRKPKMYFKKPPIDWRFLEAQEKLKDQALLRKIGSERLAEALRILSRWEAAKKK